MKSILLLLTLLISFSLFSSEGEQKEIRRTFSFHAERIADVSMLLSKIYLVPVCSEEARYFPRESDSEKFKMVLDEREKAGFDVKAENQTLPEVLDNFVKKYPEYKWEDDVKNGVFNIFPKENAPGDIIKENIKIEKKSLEEILEEKTDLLDTLSNKIIFELGRGFVSGNFYWINERAITINEDKMKLRNILNQICRQLPMPTRWIIEEQKRYFYNGKEAIFSLRFWYYEPFETSPGKEGKDLDMYRILDWKRWYKELNKETGVEIDIRKIVKNRVKLYEKLKDRFMPEKPPEKTDELQK